MYGYRHSPLVYATRVPCQGTQWQGDLCWSTDPTGNKGIAQVTSGRAESWAVVGRPPPDPPTTRSWVLPATILLSAFGLAAVVLILGVGADARSRETARLAE